MRPTKEYQPFYIVSGPSHEILCKRLGGLKVKLLEKKYSKKTQNTYLREEGDVLTV